MKGPVVIGEYFKLQQSYEKQYGPRTVVCMQKGVFYEVYEYDPACEEGGSGRREGHAREVAMLLNMILSSSDKAKPHSRDNPFMMGFPLLKFDHHVGILLEAGYTVVKCIEDPDWKRTKGEHVPRKVVEVLSPGTNIMTEDPSANTTVVAVYIECVGWVTPERTQIICGLAWIDVCTGKNMVAEIYSREHDSVYAVQELYRYCISQQPKEVLLYLEYFPPDSVKSYIAYLDKVLEFKNFANVFVKVGEVKEDYRKIEYQHQVLSKVFESAPSPGVISQRSKNLIEELDLERMHYGRISYLILLQYCYEHNECIIRRLHKPDTTWVDVDKHLVLTHNAVVQLNLLPAARSQVQTCRLSVQGASTVKYDSVFSVVNFTSTAMGRRFLKTMLLNPMVTPDDIERYYDLTDELLAAPEVLERIGVSLKKIHDLERSQRKLALMLIKPRDLAILMKDYLQLVDVYTTLVGMNPKVFRHVLLTETEIQEFNTCLVKHLSVLDPDKLLEFVVEGDRLVSSTSLSFVRAGVNAEIDGRVARIAVLDRQMVAICEHLNGFLSKVGKPIEYSAYKAKAAEEEETVGTLTTTDAKSRVLKQKEDEIDSSLCGKLRFLKDKSKFTITSDKIHGICFEIEQTKAQLQKLLYAVFVETCTRMNEFGFYPGLVRFVSVLDYVKSNAMASLKYKYVRPKIIRDSPEAYVVAERVRHPIVERATEHKFVPNDVSFETAKGMLLYGLNGVGKSILSKSVCIAIIMAQAGMFCPGLVKLAPYRKMITRLSGHDDLFRGKSSFLIEMEELRTILRHSDENTFVAGDELCRGTESRSAEALTIATVQELVQRKTSFVLATHMHDLPESSIIKAIDPALLRICHLSTSYDEVTQALIYDRTLKEGPGESVYGVLVARSVGIDRAFIERANAILHRGSPELFSTRKSHFNSSVYLDSCINCKTPSNLDTHHLDEQSTADASGFIEHYHKNSKFNLVALCKTCHTQLHKQKKKLVKKEGVAETIVVVAPLTTAGCATITSIGEH